MTFLFSITYVHNELSPSVCLSQSQSLSDSLSLIPYVSPFLLKTWMTTYHRTINGLLPWAKRADPNNQRLLLSLRFSSGSSLFSIYFISVFSPYFTFIVNNLKKLFPLGLSHIFKNVNILLFSIYYIHIYSVYNFQNFHLLSYQSVDYPLMVSILCSCIRFGDMNIVFEI